MGHARVLMPMCVGLICFPRKVVLMLVMFIVGVSMGVCQPLVQVVVRMMLHQVQPISVSHQPGNAQTNPAAKIQQTAEQHRGQISNQQFG